MKTHVEYYRFVDRGQKAFGITVLEREPIACYYRRADAMNEKIRHRMWLDAGDAFKLILGCAGYHTVTD